MCSSFLRESHSQISHFLCCSRVLPCVFADAWWIILELLKHIYDPFITGALGNRIARWTWRVWTSSKKLLKHRQKLGINRDLCGWSPYPFSHYFFGLGGGALFGLFLVSLGLSSLRSICNSLVEVLVEEFFSSASLWWMWPWGTHKYVSSESAEHTGRKRAAVPVGTAGASTCGKVAVTPTESQILV